MGRRAMGRALECRALECCAMEGRVPSRPLVFQAAPLAEVELGPPSDRAQLEGWVLAVGLAGCAKVGRAMEGRVLEGRVPSRPFVFQAAPLAEVELGPPNPQAPSLPPKTIKPWRFCVRL